MALINIETAIRRVEQIVARLAPPGGVEILTYKRNRGVIILVQDNGRLLVRERGYAEKVLEIEPGELARILKAITGREFPRSRKVRLYQLSGPDDAGVERKKI
ncbi:MAG: hypothetical protein ACOY32_02615 [Thermodesulfobacteriota bacterium]